jgi:hypothetical protein
LAANHLKIWSTQRAHCQQWKSIRLPRFQGVLSINWNEALLRIRVPYPVQRRSGKGQWANLLRHKKMSL